MEQITKVMVAIVGVAMVTTLVLPGRQTPAVIRSGGDAFSKALKAATGT